MRLRSLIQMKNGKEYVIKFSKQAEKDKIKLKSSGLDKNCINILVLMKNDPFCYPLSYEKLSGDLSGLYSRRINIQHRLVYQVYNEPIIAGEIEYNGTIKIIRMWTHYDKVR